MFLLIGIINIIKMLCFIPGTALDMKLVSYIILYVIFLRTGSSIPSSLFYFSAILRQLIITMNIVLRKVKFLKAVADTFKTLWLLNKASIIAL